MEKMEEEEEEEEKEEGEESPRGMNRNCSEPPEAGPKRSRRVRSD